MRINNNLMAMNTHRQLGLADAGAAKSTEKLSSGYRINRAGDDAAGLAISEKMRGQIRGLNQASSNAQDAISLIQTTEGALNETHAILQRMRELAVQSSTDTNTGADRANLQDEIDQLSSEITRISTTTQFNTMNLLDGSFDNKKFHIGANEKQDIGLAVKDMGANALKVDGKKYSQASANAKAVVSSREGASGLKTVTIAAGASGTGNFKEEYKVTLNASGTGYDITLRAAVAAASGVGQEAVKAGTITEGQLKTELEKLGYEVETAATYTGTATVAAGAVVAATATEIKGAEYGINISSQESASTAITTVNSALENVSKERSKLGAVQNRLEHTIKNLDTSAENLQASESRIRDVDMAKEMMEMTKQGILQQASTAMLAQANQAPQNVLQLLR